MKKSFTQKLVNFILSDEGTTVVEYSVMLGMIVLLAMAAIISMGNESREFYDYNAQQIGDSL